MHKIIFTISSDTMNVNTQEEWKEFQLNYLSDDVINAHRAAINSCEGFISREVHYNGDTVVIEHTWNDDAVKPNISDEMRGGIEAMENAGVIRHRDYVNL